MSDIVKRAEELLALSGKRAALMAEFAGSYASSRDLSLTSSIADIDTETRELLDEHGAALAQAVIELQDMVTASEERANDMAGEIARLTDKSRLDNLSKALLEIKEQAEEIARLTSDREAAFKRTAEVLGEIARLREALVESGETLDKLRYYIPEWVYWDLFKIMKTCAALQQPESRDGEET